MPNNYILHKGLIVDVGDHSFELQADVDATSMFWGAPTYTGSAF